MRISARGRAGQQRQREGLNELDEWTKAHPELPKITGLVVNKKTRHPNDVYAESHGCKSGDWEEWWLAETAKAIAFDWAAFLAPQNHQRSAASERTALRVREDGQTATPAYQDIIQSAAP